MVAVAKVGNKHKALRSSKNRVSGKYLKQATKTEINRRRRRLKHFKEHPNHIKGVEKLRESLGIA